MNTPPKRHFSLRGQDEKSTNQNSENQPKNEEAAGVVFALESFKSENKQKRKEKRTKRKRNPQSWMRENTTDTVKLAKQFIDRNSHGSASAGSESEGR